MFILMQYYLRLSKSFSIIDVKMSSKHTNVTIIFYT